MVQSAAMNATLKETTIVRTSRRSSESTGKLLYLVCVFSGTQVVEAYIMPIQDEIVMGRTALPGMGISTVDSTMSRHHFLVRPGTNGVVIADLGSANGTFVNRREIAGTARLEPGDVVRAGETLFLVLEQPPALDAGRPDSGFNTCNAAMESILKQLDSVAAAEISILLLGETGTGKDVLAQHFHKISGRGGRFVPVNCSAIPAPLLEASLFGHVKGAFTGADRASEGMFRAADKGTLFLDEIGEMDLELQAKLLRALETQAVIPVGAVREIHVDVRIIAATSRKRSELESGRLREDLLARLEDLVLQLPPLRERREDVLMLAGREMNLEPGLPFGTADVAEAFLVYPWPRNVRELIRSVRSVLLLNHDAPPLRWEDLKEGIRYLGGLTTPLPGGLAAGSAVDSSSLRTHYTEFSGPSRESLIALMEEHEGNVSQIARSLGKDRKQIYRWLDRYGLKN